MVFQKARKGLDMSTCKCPFTGAECDGGTMFQDGTIGCAYKTAPDAECAWIAKLPEGVSPRDFYNQSIMEAMQL